MGKKIIRTATIGMSLNIFCKGLLRELVDEGYDVVALSTQDKDLKELGEREGVKTIGVNMERHVSPWKDFISLVKLIKVLREEKPDMVHSMTPKAGLLCMMAAWWTKVPLRVHTFTGLVWPTSKGLLRQILILTDKLTCACATHIIPEGEGVKHDLERCITKKPMRVLGFGNVKGIDLNDWKRERAKQPHSDDSLTFVFVGRIVRDKGLNELVQAFVRLRDLYPNVKLILVGPYEENLDPIMPQTKNLIDECVAIESVGSQKEVKPFYEKSDVFVFPSYREGFPNVVIEAGAMDLPSIVTDINGSREIIEEGKNGLIVPPRDEEALYEAMKWMVEHPEERRELAENARSMVASRFEQGFVRQCLLAYYQKIFSEI